MGDADWSVSGLGDSQNGGTAIGIPMAAVVFDAHSSAASSVVLWPLSGNSCRRCSAGIS